MHHITRHLALFLLITISTTLFAQTYTYSYLPQMGIYTDTGTSGTTSTLAVNYSTENLAGERTAYTNGQIKSTISSRDSSNGTLTFTIKKKSGYFVKGNSGKVFVLDMSNGDIYATSWSISNTTTASVTAMSQKSKQC